MAPGLAWSKVGPKYRTVLIGSGWWGMNIATTACQSGRCELVALCDVDENQLNPAADRIEKLTGTKPKRYKDFRECLASEKPDIAIVAAPDHWHALCAIQAVNEGAHVYVEKPISHTVLEGLAMVRAARRNDRVVQVGTHRRASPHNISAMEFLRQGRAGKIGMVRAFVHYGSTPGVPTPDSEPPQGLDWDFWCGPAPLRPFNTRIHPKGFRRFGDYANGQLGDWGIHWLDQILWWTEEKYPKTVSSVGARHIFNDNTDCPDTQIVQYQFESFTCTWEHRWYAANNAENHNIGCYFYGTEGTFHLGWQDGWTFYPASKGQPIIHEDPKLNAPDDQNIKELFDDFLHCIETKKRPICDIEIGYRSTNMALLGMLSMKAGRSVRWDGDNNTILHDPDACTLLRRHYRAPWVYPES
jgi:predicted dehydrogenase